MRRVILVLICLLLLTVSVCAADDEVSSLSSEIVVDSDGTCTVTVTAELQLSSAPKEIVFPLSSDAREISATGGSYDKDTVDGVKCVVFEAANGFSGKQTFVCSYRLPCSVEETEAGQEFTLLLPEKGWTLPINNYYLHVTFPYDVSARPSWDSAYYGDVADNYLHIQVAENTVTVTAASTTALKDHETLTMRLLFPKDTFDLRHLPGRTATVDRVLFYLLLLSAVGYWFFRLRGGLIFPRRQQSASMETTAGEIPCQLYGQMPDVAAMLAHWGNLGYVSISRNARGRILLQREMEMGNERKPAERKLFSAIFRHGDTCDAQSLRFRAAVKKGAAPLRAGWVTRVFQKNGGSPYVLRAMALLAGLIVGVLAFDLRLPAIGARWVLLPLLALLTAALCLLVQFACASIVRRRRIFRLLPGLFAAFLLLRFGRASGCSGIMLLNVLLQAFCALTTLFGGKRTPVGEELVCQLLGLRSFLRRADRDSLQQLSRADGQYFYRMLPFAEALGVGAAFARRFADWQPEPCAWLHDAGASPSTTAEFYRLYAEIASAIRLEPYGRLTNASGQPLQTVPPRRRAHRTTEYDFDEDQ